MRSVIFIVSSVLLVSSSLDTEELCPKNVEPCTCEGFFRFRYLTCSDFDNITQVKSVLRTFSTPIAHLTIKHDFIQLTSDPFRGACINRLNLELNQSRDISDSLFASQSECLNLLSITDGKVQNVPIAALLPLRKLSTLSLANNLISELTEPLRRLKLLTLVLNGNGITRIHSDVFPLGLKSLSLSNNHLETLNSSLVYLNQLYWLMVTNNKLKTLNDELIGLNKLEVLLAGGNEIENLDDSLNNLTTLQTLDLSRNQIRTLDHSFRGLHGLFKVNLSGNLLTELFDDDFSSLVNLGVLDLSQNQLHSLRNSLRPLRTLRVLKLDGNQLVEIGDSFNCLNDLRSLVLSGNLLENLDFLLSHASEEQDAECHFTERNLLRIIHLSDNPLQCRPNVTSVITKLIEKNVIMGENPC